MMWVQKKHMTFAPCSYSAACELLCISTCSGDKYEATSRPDCVINIVIIQNKAAELL